MSHEQEQATQPETSRGRRLLSTIVLLGSLVMIGISAWGAYVEFAEGDLKPACMCVMGVFAGFFAFVWAWDLRQSDEDDLFISVYGVGGKASLGGKGGSGKASARYYPSTNIKETERYKK